MEHSIETIAQRINALGLREPTIQPRGGRNANEILVQLPGVGDPAEALGVIQAGGQLELRFVRDPVTYPSVAAYMAQHTVLPPGTELLMGTSEGRNANGVTDKSEVWYVLDRAPIVTGRDLRSAVETRNTSNPGMWQVNFTLSPEA